MNEATGGKKLLSLILMIGGLAMLVFSLALDFMGTKAAYRGALLVIGILAVIAGMYILPTLKYHRTLIYVIFLFPLLFHVGHEMKINLRFSTAASPRSADILQTKKES